MSDPAAAAPVEPPAPIEVLVIGGYLGAGKTTLVNHLLRTGTGRRTLVLVNDFGSVAVDDDLIESDDGEVLTLANGCVCCSLQDPLADTFAALAERTGPDRPELVVVETSGVADPAPVSHHAMVPGFALDAVVVVVDAETVRRRAADRIVGRTVERQLAAAELLIVNKLDLVEPAALGPLEDWLAERAPAAARVQADHARVPPALLVGDGAGALPRTGGPVRPSPVRPSPVTSAVTSSPATDHQSWTWIPPGPVGRDRLLAALDALGDDVVRAKGAVVVDDTPGRFTTVQVVGRRRELHTGRAITEAVPLGRIVVIGPAGGLDVAALEASFAAVGPSSGDGSPGASTMGG